MNMEKKKAMRISKETPQVQIIIHQNNWMWSVLTILVV
jgi:hypothetical protein